ncbi:amino acid ABC transporter permease [Dethiosulfatarculus sandiegensis]|uniref:Putative glutamine transport system permease protein GlnP n=1 Tax=Dethiosulfatarculus sandiegensis TaxID=1429043 RepID=A0A0D2J0E6_9BACT|nr:amino acid ABC transporter permease [Dethiosulfatarculus sandiegensis]KIX11714.1 ABC transporter permease [Dethiosulfatarculus sandiegensis]
MYVSSGLEPRRTRKYYLTWGSFFFALVFILVGLLYYSTQMVDYSWRWYRVPQYFFFQEEVEVRAEVQGEVLSVKDQKKKALVTVGGEGEKETYTVPLSGLWVEQGDFINMGDVLASHKEWQVGILLQGLWLTLKVSLVAIIFGTILGLFTGLARISQNPTLRWGAVTYIEIVRGSPLLVQIFIWYFVFGTLINSLLNRYGMPSIPPLWFGVAALSFFAGAYVAEIVRAGIQSVHTGQNEAARSLGMSASQAMRHVILPQAFRRILPPLAGQFISLIKDSSLLGIIAIRELTKATREVVTTSLQPFELWFVCALLYLVLTFTFSMLVQYLERRTVMS